jgi:RNA polymerase sigma-70 factor, ECF subfamily
MNAAVVLPKARSESMNELWRIHSAGLRRFALKLTQGNEHRADEVIQETLVRAWRHPDADTQHTAAA